MNIRLLRAFFLLSLFFCTAAYPQIKTYYFSRVDFMPPEDFDLSTVLLTASLKGFAENSTLHSLLKNNFYFIHKPQGTLPALRPGCYIVEKDLSRSTLTMHQPELNIKIIISYTSLPDGDYITERRTFFQNQKTDHIRYFYRSSGALWYASSERFGIHFFKRPVSIKDRLYRYWIIVKNYAGY